MPAVDAKPLVGDCPCPDGGLDELEPAPVRYPNAEENVVGERRPVRLGLPDLDGGWLPPSDVRSPANDVSLF